MTREEFIKVLVKEDCPYKIEGDKIVVLGGVISEFHFGSLETIPPGVVFMNKGYVSLDSLKTIPPGVEFNNGGNVYLESLKTISPGVEFNNRGEVELDSLIGGDLNKWSGLIEGIAPNTLLNGMIKRGIFL
jgi:hypothetical protein